MSIGIFLDPDHAPTTTEVFDALGAKKSLWQELEQYLVNNYPIPGEWSFGGKNYGWNVWYRKSGKTLVNLFPQKSSFTAQIVLGKDQVEQALAAKLGKHVATILKETPQLHDGRWLFVQVKTKQDIKDIQKLLALKRKPKPQSSRPPHPIQEPE